MDPSAPLKENQDGQAEGTTRHHSRVDVACARETTIQPAGTGLCRSGGSTTQPATQPANAAHRDHGMAAATHRTTLIRGKRFPGAVNVARFYLRPARKIIQPMQ